MTPTDPFAVAGRLIERRKNGIRHIDEEKQEIEILAAEVVRLTALVEEREVAFDCLVERAEAAEQRAESLQAQSDNFKAVAINYIDRFEHTEAKLATLSQHAEAMAVWIENEAVWIENDPAAFAEIVEAHPQYRKAFPKPNPEATLSKQIDDAKLYQTIKSQIERREFQYRVEESADGFEPQMLYTLGRLDGFAWFPLTANGYWADPDAFTDGEIKIRSVQTKEDAERAIVCAKRINGEKLISAAFPRPNPEATHD